MSEEMRILIAYDGSECAENSINDLPRAGLPREAEALLVSVDERWLRPPSSFEIFGDIFGSTEPTAAKTAKAKPDPEIDQIAKESPMLLRALEKLKANFPDWKIEMLSLRGSPSRQITGKAADWNADLVVVGSHGNTENRTFPLGSVSQKIANESFCSVHIVRGSAWKKGAPTRILIGLDGTHSAQMAVEEVARRMWMTGSEVRFVTAKDPVKSANNSGEENKAIDDWINTFTKKAKSTLGNTALGLSQIIEEGDPKQIIIAAADEWGADCIFIGSNKTEASNENYLLGSVATAIVARAHCTVEVVRHRK